MLINAQPGERLMRMQKEIIIVMYDDISATFAMDWARAIIELALTI